MKITKLTGKVSSYQAEDFPVMSSKGNKYVMVLYYHDTNAILAGPLKPHSQKNILNAQIKLHEYPPDRGFTTRVQILDNECSKTLKRYFQGQEMKFQFVPSNIHRTNAAEIAIPTFKYHFIAGLVNVQTM